MNIIIIGTGGIGTFYGMKLLEQNNKVTFIARGKNLEYLKTNSLKLTHPDFEIEEKINVISMQELNNMNSDDIDMVFITTKSMATKEISKQLQVWIKDKKHIPYFISLQNGVENEDIMCEYLPKEYVIGAITRLIAAHIISLGHVDSTGEVQTVIGALYPNEENQKFLEKLKIQLDKTNTTTILTSNIKLELWNKLIINNGVNAICALVEEKSGTLINHNKASKLVHGLMSEAALASKAVGLNISQEGADKMFKLMKGFDSIKPSMWIDTQNNRDLELDEICGVVIKNCEKQGLDAPYTRSVSTLLEIIYDKKRDKF